MRKRRAIPLRQIAPQQAASHRTPRSDNHHRNARRNPASKVGKQKDRNSRIHKNRKHNSQNALSHAQPPGTSPGPNQPPRLRCRSPFNGFFQAPQYRTSYSSWTQLGHMFVNFGSSLLPADSEDTLRFSELTGVRPMIETYPLERAGEAYARMMSGNAQFRVVLTM